MAKAKKSKKAATKKLGAKKPNPLRSATKAGMKMVSPRAGVKKLGVKKAGAKKVSPRPGVKKAATKPRLVAATDPRQSWLDETAQFPVIDRYARQLESFVAALADGIIEESEVQAQEKRLVKLMKEVEPLLDADLHVKVTQLLCELTAYDIMQILHAMNEARSQSEFVG